jgi:hypothetical protein
MPKQDRYCLNTLRAQLLDHPVYAEVASVEDLRPHDSTGKDADSFCIPIFC